MPTRSPARFDRLEQVDLVILSVGVLGAQSGLDAEPNEVTQVLRTNFLGCGSLLWHTMRALRKQGHGTAVVLSSVAAERARASNAIYGAAKAGLDALAQGLADAVAGTNVRVLVIRPGFVGTRMTAGLKPGPLSTSPQVGRRCNGRGAGWPRTHRLGTRRARYVFAVLRHLPGPVYRRLPL